MKLRGEKGAILVIVILMIMLLSTLGIWALSQAFHQRSLVLTGSNQRMVAYYRAQSGIVDAMWRIRHNYTQLDDGGTIQSE